MRLDRRAFGNLEVRTGEPDAFDVALLPAPHADAAVSRWGYGYGSVPRAPPHPALVTLPVSLAFLAQAPIRFRGHLDLRHHGKAPDVDFRDTSRGIGDMTAILRAGVQHRARRRRTRC